MAKSKIRASARGEECTVRLHCCNRNPETTVFAHAPVPHRAGMRNHNHWGAYACSDCHDRLDGRDAWLHEVNSKSEEWLRAIALTQEILIKKGLLVCS